ncbi:unnamed protein product [Chrysoparadoxa australica]
MLRLPARRALHVSLRSSSLIAPQFRGRYLSTQDEGKTPGSTADSSSGLLSKWMGPETSVADPSFTNRWAMVAPAFLTHMCIGSPWAWSMMSGPVSRELGVVASSAGDWSMAEASFPLGIVFALQGIAAAVAGKWAMKVGPRAAMSVASLCFGGGLVFGAAGIEMHSLPLLYAGYGLIGGTGVGVAYTPPVQALISWFPDKKGLASGLTIAGFGSGALVFTPAVNNLMAHFSKMPTYLGPLGSVTPVLQDGKLFVDGQEVVTATSTDLAKLGYDIAEGVYVVGTGTTGAAPSLAVLGAAYGAIMLASSFIIKTPAPGYKPAGWEPPLVAEGDVATTQVGNVTPSQVLKIPQFHMLGTTFFCVACGGMGLMSVAKPMMGEVFSSTLPNVVTAVFASQYVQMLAAGNLGGRIGWAEFSDRIGRRPTFMMFTMGSIPLYLSIPYCVDQVVQNEAVAPLVAFIGSTIVAISFMGGVYAILPAYEADLFGSKYVGPIHGRMLLYSAGAALAGPTILQSLRSSSEATALNDLLGKVDPSKFESTFQVPISQANDLIAAKALTIPRLMDIAPAGVVDPSPYVYDSTMYTMAGLMGVASVAHGMVKPIDPRHFEDAVVSDVNLTPVGDDDFKMHSTMASHMIPHTVLGYHDKF